VIGNPQNILIGSLGRLDFWTFLAICAVPALFSLLVIFAVVWLQCYARITRTVLAATLDPPQVRIHPLDRNQTIKGAVAMLALLLLFATPLPR
jgi:Na+/H+ antiporter NhaD/arsenite permease-like protein